MGVVNHLVIFFTSMAVGLFRFYLLGSALIVLYLPWN